MCDEVIIEGDRQRHFEVPLLLLLVQLRFQLLAREIEDADLRRVSRADVCDQVEVRARHLFKRLNLVRYEPQGVATARAAERLDLGQAPLAGLIVLALDVDARAFDGVSVSGGAASCPLARDHGLDGPGLDFVVRELQRRLRCHGPIVVRRTDDQQD